MKYYSKTCAVLLRLNKVKLGSSLYLLFHKNQKKYHWIEKENYEIHCMKISDL